MRASHKNIYLSAVGSEFKSCKSELAHALTQRGFLVKFREDFADDNQLLEKLEEYIRQCEAVICLVGQQYGDEPDSARAEAFADISRGRHSYAQWEYVFGAHIAKSVHVFCPSTVFKPEQPTEESRELKDLQAQFRSAWIEGRGVEPVQFDSYDSLREEALVLPHLNPNAVEPVIARSLSLENPYVGLRKFAEQDACKFFGRNSVTDEIIQKVASFPLVTVFGRSGSGKSSVVQAGVIPRFRKENPGARVIVFSPEKNPFHSLGTALMRAGLSFEVGVEASEPSPTKFNEIRQMAGNPDEPWLIFIDQFEEIFTRPEKQDSPVIFQFVNSLIQLAEKPDSKVRVVLAIRDYFMGRLGEYRGLPAITDRNLVRINPPVWEELCEIVELPAANHGVRYEPGLVARIVSHVEGRPQRLPLLQFALQRLWNVEQADQNQFGKGMVVDEDFEKMGGLHDRRINRSSYNAIKGVEGALSERMASIYTGRTLADRRILRNILLCFVQIAETDHGVTPVSRSVSFQDLKKAGGIGSKNLIQEMVREEIIVEAVCSIKEDRIYELVHEILLVAWVDLNRWVNEIRDAAQIKRALSADAEKQESGKAGDFLGLWSGAMLDRVLECSKPPVGSSLSDFDRVGGLTESEKAFLSASGDRYVQAAKHHLGEASQHWQKSKKNEHLWSGVELNRALEMSQAPADGAPSDFDRIGGLDKTAIKFLKVSERQRYPKTTGLRVALVAMTCVALLAMFTPLGAVVSETVGWSDTSSMLSGIKEFIEGLLPAKK
ncbi:MAG: DUF4062 domain-containing protein [Verrucomicrobiales bacterium]|nr:DUF4062 domain-containing protein [Verrucomicrobiales bacterium]